MPKLNWNDHTGRQWSCRVDLSDARRLRDNGNDIFDPRGGIAKLFSDVLETIEFIAELCRPEWEQSGMSYEQFSDCITGGENVFRDASEALKDGLCDFFRRLDRPALAMVIERAWKTATAMETQALENAGGEKVAGLLSAMMVKAQTEFEKAIDAESAKLQKPGG